MVLKAAILAAALVGKAYSQCNPFNQEPVGTGVDTTCAVGEPADEAVVGTTCTVACSGDNLPDIDVGSFASRVDYTCSQPEVAAGCNGDFWKSDLSTPFSCSPAANCPIFTDSTVMNRGAFSTLTCSRDVGGTPTPVAEANATQIDDTCVITGCQAGWALVSNTPADNTFACNAGALSSSSEWSRSVVTTNPVCQRITCTEFVAASQFDPTTVTASCTNPGGMSTTPDNVQFGGRCSLVCSATDQAFPVGATNLWQCEEDATWSNADATPVTSCAAVTCTSFDDFIATVPNTEADVCGTADPTNSTEYAFGTECTIAACADGFELRSTTAATTYTCVKSAETLPTTAGVWNDGNEDVRCVPIIDCMAFDNADVPNGMVTCTPGASGLDNHYGAECTVACSAGSSFIDETDKYTCMPNDQNVATWIGTANCAVDCVVPTVPANSVSLNCVDRDGDSTTITDPQPIDAECAVFCSDGFGYEVANVRTFTCSANADITQPGNYSTAPVCSAVQCPAFNTLDTVTEAVFGQCNDPAAASACQFDQANNVSVARDVSCEIASCSADFRLDDASERVYTCNQVGTTSVGVWEPSVSEVGASCNEICSEQYILSKEGEYNANCCETRNNPCPVAFGGCANDTQCAGDLICGAANVSCSAVINAIAPNSSARCCITAPTAAPPVDTNPDGGNGASAIETHVATIVTAAVAIVSLMFVV